MFTYGVANEIYYYHNDHLGTPKVVTDATGAIAWQGDYTPFGEVTETVNLIEQPFRFPGQYFDSETNLHYNYFRDYDPSIGRYIQSDPIGLRGGINTYGYVGQNPLRFTDYYGLEIDGTWRIPPMPAISNIAHQWGDSRKIPTFHPFLPAWSNLELGIHVTGEIYWSVNCTDTSECQSDSWTVSGSTGTIAMHFYLPIKVAAVPQIPYLITLQNISDFSHIRSKAFKHIGGLATMLENALVPKIICMTMTRD